MGLLGNLFGNGHSRERPKEAQSSAGHASGHSQSHSHLASAYSVQGAPGPSTNSTRRELLRVVLRDTMNRHGIPSAWLSAETLIATSRNREQGIHWRLRVLHWDPRLMLHAVAFQHSLIGRVMTFDPMAGNWLMGISWQFALPDESVCPPMPHAMVWTSPPEEDSGFTAPAPIVAGPSGDVIAGPVRIADAEDENAAATKADLERLMALRDADFQRHGGGPASEGTHNFEPTRPSSL